MKKLAAFSVSFGAAFAVFAVAAVLCLGISLGKDGMGRFFASGEDFASKLTAQSSEPEADNAKAEEAPVSVLIIYDGDGLFCCRADLYLGTGKAVCTPIDCSGYCGKKVLSDIYDAEGTYPFVTACGEICGKKMRFVKFTSESFAKTADRLNGIVYNDGSETVLLTGKQAEDLFTPARFAGFCAVLATKMLEKDIVEEFGKITALCECDFSFPEFNDLQSKKGN